MILGRSVQAQLSFLTVSTRFCCTLFMCSFFYVINHLVYDKYLFLTDNYLGFPQSFSSAGAKYPASTNIPAKQLSFWIYFHGDALLLLWRIQKDSSTDIIYVNNGANILKDEWVQINLLLDDSSNTEPIKVFIIRSVIKKIQL